MRARVTILAGAAAGIGALAARLFRRRVPPEREYDPRAEQLRRRLDESRAVVGARDELEAAETPVDEVEPLAEGEAPPPDVDERRRAIHDRARTAADEMRGDDDDR